MGSQHRDHSGPPCTCLPVTRIRPQLQPSSVAQRALDQTYFEARAVGAMRMRHSIVTWPMCTRCIKTGNVYGRYS